MHTQTLSPINYIQRANFFKIVLIGIAICIISNNGYAAPVKVIKLKGTHVVDANIYIPVKFLAPQYSIYSPESCSLILSKSLNTVRDTVAKKTYFEVWNNQNLIKIDRQLSSQQDVTRFFEALREGGYFKGLCFYYYDTKQEINRYILVDDNAKKLREVKILSTSDRTIEVSLFSQSGVQNSKVIHQFKKDTTEKINLWADVAKLEKISQYLYYPSGQIRAKINYKNSLLSDTLTMFDSKGTIVRQTIYVAGKVKKEVLTVQKSMSAPADYKKAFLVGIEKYTEPVNYNVATTNKKYIPVMEEILGMINDVNLLKNVLVANQGFKPENIKLLTDGQATRQGVLDNLAKFTAQLAKDDVVYLHFSACNFTDVVRDGFILTADYYKSKADTTNKYWITISEMQKIFNGIKRKIGAPGQLVVSYDASGSGGTEKSKVAKKTAPTDTVKFRGESDGVLFSSNQNRQVPFLFLSGTSENQLAYGTTDVDDKPYGLFSYNLAQVLKYPYPLTGEDLIDEIKLSVTVQTPLLYSSFPQFVFERNQTTVDDNLSLSNFKSKGNTHVISVGISKYPKLAKLSFENCVADAASYNDYFTDQYTSLTGTGKVFSYLLTDSLATKNNIIAAINKTMASKADDYFVFNFSGYTVPLRDSLGKQVTYFVPYGLKSLTDTALIKKEGISLTQLKDLLQMIPANNQLFITEAGSTANFQKEFIKNLIESSPTMASLSNKNRVFILPKGAGMDNAVCNNTSINHGPINYYLTSLGDDLNIYGLFESELYIDALKYAISKVETDCDYMKTGYFDVFFERNFIKDLQFFMPNQVGQMRGVSIINETKQKLISQNSNRYALVVGTSLYKAKPQWKDLPNPVLDAKAIAEQLENNYDYKVTTMLDKPLDSIYNRILDLSRTLKASDQLIIFIAGHGDFDANLLDDGLIVTTDSKPSAADPFRNSYLQYSKLSRMINKLPANQIMLIMDVCFSGTFDDRVKREEGRSQNTIYDDVNAAAYIEGKLGKKTRLFITSGGKKEVPDGYAGQHSPFAQRLIMMLQDKGGAANMLTATNLHQCVEKLPSGPLIGGFGDNVIGSEFLLIPRAKKDGKIALSAKN
jgi:antitoxin component YwqK of YwqJK toxin-antitoxin module